MATKRAVRAMLKAADVCAVEPDRAARFLLDRGYAKDFDFIREYLKMLAYSPWRDYDPEDAIRFYAVRLRECAHRSIVNARIGRT